MWRNVRYWLLLVGLAAFATCPAAWRKFRTDQRAGEAHAMLRYMASLVRAEYAARDGRFPQQPVGPTPPVARCCAQGGTCEVDKDLWLDPGWRAIRFSIDDKHRYAYSYRVEDNGRVAVLTATGDLDCDEIYGTVELRLEPGAAGELVETWTEDQPTE